MVIERLNAAFDHSLWGIERGSAAAPFSRSCGTTTHILRLLRNRKVAVGIAAETGQHDPHLAITLRSEDGRRFAALSGQHDPHLAIALKSDFETTVEP